ncbi:MAG: hypothetical protein JWN93_894 [Hyphomicrobiales bacterium]|jgi:hypothetical protein|nr:hypothetical protein [Hyphomicrobiales bacterium]
MADEAVNELPVPPDAQEAGGHEVLRAFVVDGGLSVSLQRAFDEPQTWGVLLVDLARHVARIYAEEAEMTQEQALSEIRRMFDAEWDRSTDPGATDAIN